MYNIRMDEIKKILEELETSIAGLKSELEKLDRPFSGMLEDDTL